MAAALRVLIVDDEPLVRRGLQSILEASEGIQALTAGDEATARDVLRDAPPDVMIIDLRLGGGENGNDVIRCAAADAPGTRILIMSQGSQSEIVAAIRAGAHGYIDKGADDAEVITAVRTVVHTAVLPPETAALIITEMQHPGVDNPLTARELDVLRCLAKDYDNSDIADELGISVRTVNRHLENIRDKVGEHRRSRLARFARRMFG